MAHLHYYPQHMEVARNLYSETKLLYTGRVSNLHNWVSSEHQHDFCEVMYVADGQMDFKSSGEVYRVEKGCLVLCNPRMPHAEQAVGDALLRLEFFAVTGFRFPDLEPDHLLPVGTNPVLRCGGFTRQIAERFTELLDETQTKRPYSEPIAQGMVVSILSLAMRLYGSRLQQESPVEKALFARNFIDQNFNQQITLDALAKEAKVSKHHLAHLFKEQTGTSPIKYMTERRMEEACMLLGEGGLATDEVAEQVGYTDTQYFRRLFKKLVGIPPGEYRQKMHSRNPK